MKLFSGEVQHPCRMLRQIWKVNKVIEKMVGMKSSGRKKG
jgi:hypothetical protein